MFAEDARSHNSPLYSPFSEQVGNFGELSMSFKFISNLEYVWSEENSFTGRDTRSIFNSVQ